MAAEQISNIEELLQPFILPEQKVVKQKFVSIYPTHNNHRLIRAIEVDLSDGTSLNLIAITLSEVQEVSNAALNKEIAFYNIIKSTLHYFQEKENIDELNFIPEYYGSKIDQNSKESVLLLSDLQILGYKNIKCADLGTTRQVLKDLASFHAIPLALKIKDPKVFDTKVKRYLAKEIPHSYSTLSTKKLIQFLENEFECYENFDKIRERLEEVTTDKLPRAPFSTMIHGDCYVKNFMVKTNLDGFADIKLINFQHCSYGSLAEDVIFFLYTSVQASILEEHCSSLIEFYHSNFVRVLEECKCESTPFSLDALNKELKTVAYESQFAQVISTLYSNFTEDLQHDNEESVSNSLRHQIVFVVNDFLKKNWI